MARPPQGAGEPEKRQRRAAEAVDEKYRDVATVFPSKVAHAASAFVYNAACRVVYSRRTAANSFSVS